MLLFLFSPNIEDERALCFSTMRFYVLYSLTPFFFLSLSSLFFIA